MRRMGRNERWRTDERGSLNRRVSSSIPSFTAAAASFYLLPVAIFVSHSSDVLLPWLPILATLDTASMLGLLCYPLSLLLFLPFTAAWSHCISSVLSFSSRIGRTDFNHIQRTRHGHWKPSILSIPDSLPSLSSFSLLFRSRLSLPSSPLLFLFPFLISPSSFPQPIHAPHHISSLATFCPSWPHCTYAA